MTSESPLRYAFNAHEYELLHHYLIRRLRQDSGSSPDAEQRRKRAPIHDDYHAATVRSSLRVFIGTVAGLKAWELITTSLLSRGTHQR